MEYSREMNRNSRENGTNMRGGRAANFVVQGSILAAAGILVRIIGMLYRMPLNDIIGKQGNGYYTSAYSSDPVLLQHACGCLKNDFFPPCQGGVS